MIFRLIDLIVGINACVALGTILVRRHIKQKRSRNLEEVERLEQENKQIDKMLENMRKHE